MVPTFRESQYQGAKVNKDVEKITNNSLKFFPLTLFAEDYLYLHF